MSALDLKPTLEEEGRYYAEAMLERFLAGKAVPDELETIVSFMRGDMLRGFCHVLQRALGGAHG
ncbi:hypothetical protein [Piscinibacter koreensis]|uniref:Uncharacterized protein n=1 Tax=Piscinibacter koreensis TaxID=2742824 RepID=A0A7Y6NP22_9BURK|nr:hypothetical protein [Schlegelella koreensis]NUZ06748.1 hypothetical protein [Schlegelella koreensis]